MAFHIVNSTPICLDDCHRSYHFARLVDANLSNLIQTCRETVSEMPEGRGVEVHVRWRNEVNLDVTSQHFNPRQTTGFYEVTIQAS
jgi:hypothetical protein